MRTGMLLSGVVALIIAACPAVASAACSSTGDVCTGSGSEWRVCTAFSGSTCTTFLDTTVANTVRLIRGTVGGSTNLGACVSSGGTWTFYRLATPAGALITASSMSADAYMCWGNGNDAITVMGSAFASCTGATTSAWDYGSNRLLTLRGQADDDSLGGSVGREQMCGGTGDDTLTGNSGDDDLDGWEGADIIAGSGGSDTSWGWEGDDIIQDSSGTSDWLSGEDDADCLCDQGNQFALLECGTGGTDSDTTCNYNPTTCVPLGPSADCEALTSPLGSTPPCSPVPGTCV